MRTLDTGWFAKHDPFAYARPEPPDYASGGDGWLESTPAVLPIYQARAGQLFTQAIGVARLRAYSLQLQRRLVALLAVQGIQAQGGTEGRGAFVAVRHREARAWSAALKARGVVTDARGEWLRLCPDVLTTDVELVQGVRELAAVSVGG
jgi:kynureninase